MKRLDHKSNCAINYTLEIIGDPWSMLIVRDIVYYGKRTFGEFLSSDEGIATSALYRRLIELENKGVIYKQESSIDKRKVEYGLTEKGLGLVPILLDMADWGAQHDADTGASLDWIQYVRTHRQRAIQKVQQAIKSKKALFTNNTVS